MPERVAAWKGVVGGGRQEGKGKRRGGGGGGGVNILRYLVRAYIRIVEEMSIVNVLEE